MLLYSVDNFETNTALLLSYALYFLLIGTSIPAVYLMLAKTGIGKWFGRKKQEAVPINHPPKYQTITLEEETRKAYVEVLEHTLNTTRIHLRPGLSLDELSVITHIPKHHFSNLLNVHIGKTFYQYISEYRIQEAISRIDRGDNMTVESLAYECGFNSKTSFNRYFKEITGYTPSEYRDRRMISYKGLP